MNKNQYNYISTIQTSRFRHTAIIGQSQTGKSNLSNQLVQADIENDQGLFHIDLDGTDTDTILSLVPKRRIKDVVLLDLADINFPVSVNPFAPAGAGVASRAPGDHSNTAHNATIAETFVDAFKSIWGYEDMATPDMDRTIHNAARAVLDLKGGTILDMYAMLTDPVSRERIAQSVQDPIIRHYWQVSFNGMDERGQSAVTKSTVNKLERFISDERIRNCFGHSKPLFDFQSAMQNRKIVLLKIPQSEFGLNKARTIAGLLLAQFFGVAQRRKGLIPFHLYLPECQHFIGDTMKQMLATLGKQSISITLTCQYLEQLGKLRPAVFGNVGNWFIFRVGLTDALLLEELFEWDNTRKFLYELEPFEARIMTPETLPTSVKIACINLTLRNYKTRIVKHSRHFYARPRGKIEKRSTRRRGK